MADYNQFYGYSGNRNPWFPDGRPIGPPPPPPGRPVGPPPPGRPVGSPPPPGRPMGPPAPGRPVGPSPGNPVRPPQVSGKRCPCVRGWNLDENGGREQDMRPELDETENDFYRDNMNEQNRMEEEWLYMKQLYPNKARKLLRYIEDTVDQLEYENSMMFDERPDQNAVDMLVKDVIGRVEDTEPELLRDDSMNNGGTDNENTTWNGCAEILIYVLLVTEMHHRRRRYFMLNDRNY